MPSKTGAYATDQGPDYALGSDFGARLADARKARALSQDEVGRRAGVRGTMVGRYERAEARPSVEIAARLARAVRRIPRLPHRRARRRPRPGHRPPHHRRPTASTDRPRARLRATRRLRVSEKT